MKVNIVETDRVTRFKLVKSGKHWLRAATSNFGLFKVLRGGVDTPSVASQQVEVDAPAFSGQTVLKGVLATGPCLVALLRLMWLMRMK